MKKSLFLIMVSLLFSCSEVEDSSNQSETVTVEVSNENSLDRLKFEYGEMDVYYIQEIDGCEYITVNGRESSEPAITHKGNCKYCAQRSEERKVAEERNERGEY